MRRAIAASVGAGLALTAGVLALIRYYDADPLNVQWAKLVPLGLAAVAVTSALCAMLPIRRHWLTALVAGIAAVIVFLMIGTALDRMFEYF